MIYLLISLAVLIVFILIAIRVGVTREKEQEKTSSGIIHQSGIYSIVRRSPRENVDQHKPAVEEIRKYLSSQNVDMFGKVLTPIDKETLLASWHQILEKSIIEVEEGDKKGTQFYYYELSGDDPVCKDLVPKGNFVTREQIYHYPNVIPPFHLGCRCELKCYLGDENLRDTRVFGMRPFFTEGKLPHLPEWKKTITPA
jgi:hypothetical protein